MKLVYDEFLKKVEQSDCKKLISLRQRGKIMEFKIFVIIIMPPSKILTAGS